MQLISVIRIQREDEWGIIFLKGQRLGYLSSPGNILIKLFGYLNLNHCDLFEIWDFVLSLVTERLALLFTIGRNV